MNNALEKLTVVMPVFNEEECINDVVQAWYDELTRLQIDFLMIVLNDGSRDGTEKCLERFALQSRIRIINKINSGHGPTILEGYRISIEGAEWVFQTDSDNEMSPASFKFLWSQRTGYDALFGVREARVQGFGRKLISEISRYVVQLLFCEGVEDVNTPYRLLRVKTLSQVLGSIPSDACAPNILISGALALSGVRIYNHPVRHEGRKTGSASLVRWALWIMACKALWQTLFFRYLQFKKIVDT